MYTGITMSTSDVCRVSFRRLFETGITLMAVTVHPCLLWTVRATCEDHENSGLSPPRSPIGTLSHPPRRRGRGRESSFGVRLRCTVLVGCGLGRGGRGWGGRGERGP